MEAIVLAGGFGTRLQGVVSDVPKSMAPINHRPFLEYLLDDLNDFGIQKVVLSVGYKHEVIEHHFGGEYKSIKLDYAIENEPLGTGGGIRLSLWKISDSRALVLNGDTIFKVDYSALHEFHLRKKADATLALFHTNDTTRYGRVNLGRAGRITGFTEKNGEIAAGNINGGVYIVEKDFLMNPGYRGRFSMENDCFGRDYETLRLFGFVSNGYFRDIGVPEDYQKAQDEFAKFQH